MFTGIVEATGEVVTVEHRDRAMRATISTDVTGGMNLLPGNSIAVNGVCLTVVAIEHGQRFSIDISGETLACTTFNTLRRQQRVNLERPLTLASKLDGHLVSGHIDGIGAINAIQNEGRASRLQIQIPSGLLQYVARKGSICIDGVSLTVNEVDDDAVDIMLIPHTLRHTILSDYETGGRVNVEVDLIARYLERLLRSRQPEAQQ